MPNRCPTLAIDDGPHKVGDWDQFEANKKLFGVDSTYNEEIYTTKLDKSKLSSKHAKAAERLAREIESSSSKNFHMAEERGQKHQSDDLDEESRYSSGTYAFAGSLNCFICIQ